MAPDQIEGKPCRLGLAFAVFAYNRFIRPLKLSRRSYQVEEKDFIFMAGGIGITPLMSMPRHMRDTLAPFRVLLIYANSIENDIIFRSELAAMETGGYLRLKEVRVLSRPGKDRAGETGHIDRERINRLHDGDFRERAFYVCGSKGLLKATLKKLRGLGAAGNRIHHEIFSFPN